MYNIVSFCGIFVIMLVAWLFSGDRRSVNWRAVFWGTALQLVFAFFVFRVRTGLVFFGWVNSAVMQLMSSRARDCISFSGLWGFFPVWRARRVKNPWVLSWRSRRCLRGIFFVIDGSVVSCGAMQMIVKAFSSLFTRFMRISGAESLCAASNILVGIESVFTVRPYLDAMTLSELGLVLTSGMATIAPP
jgi:CNT family concentrative nucleoside transporter